jgi:hypothetical protein
MCCKQISDAPPTFVWGLLPLAAHPSITAEDEPPSTVIRAEISRVMRLTFVAPHVTRMVPLPNPTHARAAHPSFLPGPPIARSSTFRPTEGRAHAPTHAWREGGGFVAMLRPLGRSPQEYAFTLDLKGSLPKWLVNNVAAPELMQLAYTVQSYFAQQLSATKCKAADAQFLGTRRPSAPVATGRATLYARRVATR